MVEGACKKNPWLLNTNGSIQSHYLFTYAQPLLVMDHRLMESRSAREYYPIAAARSLPFMSIKMPFSRQHPSHSYLCITKSIFPLELISVYPSEKTFGGATRDVVLLLNKFASGKKCSAVSLEMASRQNTTKTIISPPWYAPPMPKTLFTS